LGDCGLQAMFGEKGGGEEMKFTKLFGEGCKELGMGVKPTRDGVEITPTVESMDKLIAFMGGIPAEPEASRGSQKELK